MKNRRYNLFEICNPKQWKTISIDKLDKNAKYPVYGANGIIGYYSEYNHEKPTLCITCRGATSGELNITTSYSYINGNTMALDDLDETKVDINFLYYYLKKRGFKDVTSGSAQPQITRISLKKINLFLPELSIQKKVSNLLLLIDDTIKSMQRKITLLEQLIKSLFTSMFGDIKTNDKNWEITKFAQIISILTDYHANGSYKILKDNVELLDFKDYALMVRTTDLENNNFIQGVKYINEKAYNFLKKTKIFGGEIIINKIGSAGNIYLMPLLNRPVSLGMNQFMIRLKKEHNNVFYYKLLITEYYTNVIKNNVQGAVTKTITKDAIKNIDIIVPPIELQNKFAERVEKIEKLSFEIEKSIKEAENLYNSLINKYFE